MLDLGDILHHQSVDARLCAWDGDAGFAGFIAIQQRANIGGDALDHANMKTRGHLPRKAGAQGMELLGGTIGCPIMLDMQRDDGPRPQGIDGQTCEQAARQSTVQGDEHAPGALRCDRIPQMQA